MTLIEFIKLKLNGIHYGYYIDSEYNQVELAYTLCPSYIDGDMIYELVLYTGTYSYYVGIYEDDTRDSIIERTNEIIEELGV